MDTVSLWHTISEPQRVETYPVLNEEIEVDVAIIGGGITGLTTAYHLQKAGKKVAILETYRVGDGTTGNSTGNLYIETQPYFQNIEKKFSLEIAKKIAHSRRIAIDEIEKNINELNIDCNFSRRPWYLFANKNKEVSFLNEEIKTFHRLGVDINYISSLPLPFKFQRAAKMSNQARFNPLKYALGLASYLKKQNCLIFENSKVIGIDEKKIVTLTTANGKVIAKKIIIATHTPKGVNPVQMFTAPYRSYVIAVRLKDGTYPEGHFWGLGKDQNISSTHAISAENKPELLLVAGRHHKTGQSKNTLLHFQELEQYLKKQFPPFDIAHHWSAQHYLSADDIPYIGLANRRAKHTYIATGYFADGLVYGTIAAKVLSDLIITETGFLTNIYNSNRHKLVASAGFLAKENLNIFLQYLKDIPWVSSKGYEDLKPGEGKIIEINNEKFGISRDEQNQLHIVSAVCTHMKCIVAWNNAERTWDCPCHGSRFSQDGQVLEGPAIEDLAKKDVTQPKSTNGHILPPLDEKF